MAGSPGVRRVSVRYESGIWVMRCDSCASSGQTTAYWPIDLESWDPVRGLQRCRACHNTLRRAMHHRSIEFMRERERRYYKIHRERRRAYARAYYNEHKVEINAAKRAKTVARRAQA